MFLCELFFALPPTPPPTPEPPCPGKVSHTPERITNSTTVEPLITVTSAQRLPPDLRSVKKVPAEFKVKLSEKTSQQRSTPINGQAATSYCLNV